MSTATAARPLAVVEALAHAEARFALCPDVLARRALRRAEGRLARAVTRQSNTTSRPRPPQGDPS